MQEMWTDGKDQAYFSQIIWWLSALNLLAMVTGMTVYENGPTAILEILHSAIC